MLGRKRSAMSTRPAIRPGVMTRCLGRRPSRCIRSVTVRAAGSARAMMTSATRRSSESRTRELMSIYSRPAAQGSSVRGLAVTPTPLSTPSRIVSMTLAPMGENGAAMPCTALKLR